MSKEAFKKLKEKKQNVQNTVVLYIEISGINLVTKAL